MEHPPPTSHPYLQKCSVCGIQNSLDHIGEYLVDEGAWYAISTLHYTPPHHMNQHIQDTLQKEGHMTN